MSDKKKVLAALKKMGDAVELSGGNPHQARAFRNAARTLKGVEGDFKSLHADGSLLAIRGIGKTTNGFMGEVLAGETPAALTALLEDLPEGLFEMLRLPGVGGKKVKLLHDELQIGSIAELEYACRENRLVTLSGFGAKTQAKIVEAIAIARANADMLRRDQAADLAREHYGEDVELVGAYRRGAATVKGVDVLVAKGEAKAETPELLRAHEAEQAAWGAALVWHSSSEGHRAKLIARAEERGLSFSEVGLTKKGEQVETPDEAALYAALGLSLTPAERREDDTPLVGEGKASPELITLAAIKGALHNHTTESDGAHSLEQMRSAAAERGLSYLGISEHSESAAYARGLDQARLDAQRAAIAALNEDDAGVTLLSGVESDIRQDGALDYEDEVLAPLDVVIASVHRRHRQTPEEMTARVLKAAEHPRTDLIGHPTGQLILGRPPSGLDVRALIETCARTGCAVELNAAPQRLDLDEEGLRMAKEAGVLVAISADAHAMSELDRLEHGIALARRAGISPEDVLNARTLSELQSWLGERRAKHA